MPYHFGTRNTKCNFLKFCPIESNKVSNGEVLKPRYQIWMKMEVLIKAFYIGNGKGGVECMKMVYLLFIFESYSMLIPVARSSARLVLPLL